MQSGTQFQHEYAGHLVREALAGRMTRRELLVRAGVVGLSATLVGQVLAACGGASSGTSSGAATAGSGGTPKKGGTLVFAWDSEPATLDPAIAWNLVDWQVEHSVFESLFKYRAVPGVAGTTLEPAMAVAMPTMSNGGTTYTIKLKPGILFQPPVSREVTAAGLQVQLRAHDAPAQRPRAPTSTPASWGRPPIRPARRPTSRASRRSTSTPSRSTSTSPTWPS